MRSLLCLLVIISLALPSLQKGLECSICLQFVSSIDKKEIQEDKNLQQKLDKDCRQMLDMAVIEVYCEKLVNKEYQNILNKIMNDEKPDKICKDIEMC